MNWFNIVFVLASQCVLFWFISQMYRKNNKFFVFFSGLFLVLAFINLVVVVFSVFMISSDNSFVGFNGFANILLIFQLSILGLIIVSYALMHVLDSFKEASSVAKK